LKLWLIGVISDRTNNADGLGNRFTARGLTIDADRQIRAQFLRSVPIDLDPAAWVTLREETE
jgi:hypothetical protein